MADTQDVFSDVPALTPDDFDNNAVQLSQARNLAILLDLENNLPYRSIAAKHNASLTTVCKLAAQRRQTKDIALNYLMANGIDFAEDWKRSSEEAAKRGDHRPAKDALLHLKVIEPVDDRAHSQTGVTIIIGDGQSAAGPVPRFISAQVVDSKGLPDTPPE